MDKWEEKVKNSIAYTEAKDFLNELESHDMSEASVDAIDYANRAKLVLELLVDRLDNTDSRLVIWSTLESIGSHIANASSNFDSWISSGNDTYLASSYMDTYIDNILKQIPDLTPAVDVDGARKAVAVLNRSVGQYKRVVTREMDEITAKGTASKEAIDEKVAKAKTEFEALDTKTVELDDELKEIKDSSSKLSTEQQLAFQKAENERNNTITQFVKTKTVEIADTFKKKEDAIDKLTTDAKTKLTLVTQNAETSLKEIDNLLNIAGDKTLIHEYASSAKEDMDSANRWRIVTVVLLLIALGFSVWMAVDVTQNTPSWQSLVARAFVALFAGGIAGYTATQSSEHRKAQRSNQRTAHQLKALKPYLLAIENDRKLKNEIIKTVADRIFSKEEPVVRRGRNLLKSKEEAPVLTSQLVAVIAETVKQMAAK